MKIFKSKNLCFRYIISFLTICFIISLVAFSQGVFAQVDTGLDATAGAAELPEATDISAIIGQIIYAILGFLGVIFVILLIYGGFVRMTAGGNPEAIKKSNGIIVSAVIGIIIITASYAITAFVLSRIQASVGGDGGGSGMHDPGYVRCCVDTTNVRCTYPDASGGRGLECPSGYSVNNKPCNEIHACPQYTSN